MRVLDLFSGIGGFSLGLERAGMQTVAFCETDPFCCKVLAKHWPDIPIHNDIRTLDGRQYRGTVELVCGGFPCQPFSVAGKRTGTSDDRSLWPEMFRIIREVQPTWVIGENVPGIISMELDQVLFDLESAGYACQTFDIPACGVDAHHIRHRVWIVAHAHSGGVRIGAERTEERRQHIQRQGDAFAELLREELELDYDIDAQGFRQHPGGANVNDELQQPDRTPESDVRRGEHDATHNNSSRSEFAGTKL